MFVGHHYVRFFIRAVLFSIRLSPWKYRSAKHTCYTHFRLVRAHQYCLNQRSITKCQYSDPKSPQRGYVTMGKSVTDRSGSGASAVAGSRADVTAGRSTSSRSFSNTTEKVTLSVDALTQQSCISSYLERMQLSWNSRSFRFRQRLKKTYNSSGQYGLGKLSLQANKATDIFQMGYL